MINSLKKYIMTQEKKRAVSYLYDGEEIEANQVICEIAKSHIMCLGKKKKIVFQKKVEGAIAKNIFDIMFKSHLVIIKTNMSNRQRILHQIKFFSKSKHKYAPIVCLKNGYVLFFPKLGYQDIYFVKSLVENYEFDYEMVY